MGSGRDPGRRPPASSNARQQARIQAAFLRFYDRDIEFGESMMSLLPTAEAADITHASTWWRTHVGLWNLARQSWDRHPPERRPPLIVEITVFVSAADGLAATFGLDRLGSAGRAHILAWCDRYLRARASGSAHPSAYSPAALSTSPVSFTFEPEVDGSIGPPWELQAWDPTSESRRGARIRLAKIANDHIQAELDRIQSNAVAAGLSFPDTAPNLQRDLGWLYRKVRYRDTFQTIYDALDSPPKGGVETVRKAVLRIADKSGVDPSGWESGWR